METAGSAAGRFLNLAIAPPRRRNAGEEEKP
jgi:hypothetical protein